ncbi:hypothetical protein SK128_000172, partial [Halocaridina rubra]
MGGGWRCGGTGRVMEKQLIAEQQKNAESRWLAYGEPLNASSDYVLCFPTNHSSAPSDYVPVLSNKSLNASSDYALCFPTNHSSASSDYVPVIS